jgi:hypothetical protein
MPDSALLYRPVGLNELALIFDCGMREFPPRLPEQPIFYPVLTLEYAEQIARDWNTKEPQQAGFVTRFNVQFDYITQFNEEIVGDRVHKELWVPAADLPEFNRQIFGPIEVIAAFFGTDFVGLPPAHGFSAVADARDLLERLTTTLANNGADFSASVCLNPKCVFVNYAYWKQHCSSEAHAKTVSAIRQVWDRNYSAVRLPGEPISTAHSQ